jgi:phosphate/sulfate permease
VNTAVVRNVLIIAGLAAIVAFVPAGGDTANFVGRVLSILFTIMFVWFGVWLYRQFRTDVYGLGERHRAILYGSIGVGVFAMAASGRLLNTGVGVLVFVALLVGVSLGMWTAWRRYREYGL